MAIGILNPDGYSFSTGDRLGATRPALFTMDKEGVIALDGLIDEALPNTQFRIVLDNGQHILGYVSGKIRKNRIRILPGDRVTVELSPYDMTKGRITRRLT